MKYDLDQLMSSWAQKEENKRKTVKKKLEKVLPELEEMGYTYVHMEYYGGGDEGSMEDAYVTKEDKYFAPTHKDVKAEIWKSIADGYRFDIHGFDFYDLVDFLDYDWWNNEGGGGTIVLDIRKGKVLFPHNYYYTQEEIKVDIPTVGLRKPAFVKA